MFRPVLALAFGILVTIPGLAAQPQKQDGGQDKNFDVRSTVGDLHMGSDADARKAGLPLYPGARLRRDEENSSALNLGVLTEAFGMTLVVARYETDDASGKVIDFYRERLKKYGKVMECHTREHGADAHAEDNNDK